MRSRVLLSTKEEECDETYGPHAPLTYRDLILTWFRPPPPAEDEAPASQAIQPLLPQVSRLDVESENNQTGEQRNNQAAAAVAAADREVMRPDLSADISPSMMGKRRLVTAE